MGCHGGSHRRSRTASPDPQSGRSHTLREALPVTHTRTIPDHPPSTTLAASLQDHVCHVTDQSGLGSAKVKEVEATNLRRYSNITLIDNPVRFIKMNPSTNKRQLTVFLIFHTIIGRS